MSVQVSYKKQTVFFILLILISLSIIEITIRVYDFYYPQCNFLDSDVFDNVSHDLKLDICKDNGAVKWKTNPLLLIPDQHMKTININSDGFRGNELLTDPDYRIFLVGGSTTFGVGATSDQSTIPYFLQEKLVERFPDSNIEVINAGIPNAYSFTESVLIKNKLLSFAPNMLVIYDGWNDLAHDYEEYETGTDVLLLDKIIRFIGKSDYVTPKALLTFYFNLQYDSTDVIEFDNSNMDKKITLWKNTWEEICELGNESNFKTIITLQPLVGTGNKALSSEELTYFKKYDGQSKIDHYDSYNNALNELDSKCSTIADLRNVFDSNHETVYFDFGHVGDHGNKIVANEIYEKILPTILKDISD